MSVSLMEVYERLFQAYGPQHWWPGDSPLEVMVGAVLTQNTAWRNVERAIDNLRTENALQLKILHEMSHEELAEYIRPAGYYRLKAKRLKNLVRLICESYDSSLDAFFQLGTEELRRELLTVNGIGPETADSIVLYAANLPSFVVDAYTARVLKRHGWIEEEADYHRIQEHFVSALAQDVALYNEYHALLVRVGNQHCRKSPRCEGCPLENMLPPDGPLEPGW